MFRDTNVSRLLSMLCLTFIVACGDEEVAPIDWRVAGAWRGIQFVSLNGAKSIELPEQPYLTVVSDTDVDLLQVCPATGAGLIRLSGEGTTAYWRGILPCPVAPIPGCAAAQLEINAVEITLENDNALRVVAHGVAYACNGVQQAELTMVALRARPNY